MMNSTTISKDRYQGLMVSASGNFSFTIKTLEEQRSNEKANGCNSHYKLVFLTKGECQYVLDKRKIAVNDQTIGIVKPNQIFGSVN